MRVNETNTCTDILRHIKGASIVALPQHGDHVEIVSAQETTGGHCQFFAGISQSFPNFVVVHMRIHSVPRVPHPSCDACSWEAYRKAVEVV